MADIVWGIRYFMIKNTKTQPQNGQFGQPQGIAPTVGKMIGAFKSIVTNEYILGVKKHNWQRFNDKLWQRNYWEHIIRNEDEFLLIAQYIIDNPKKWAIDKLNDNISEQSQLLQTNLEVWMV